MKILVTGTAGFIGHATAKALLARGDDVVGIDCMNDYYDPTLKEARLEDLHTAARVSKGQFNFMRANLAEPRTVTECFNAHQFDRVIHLAAQAGVRYSIENPLSYVESNLTAFTVLIDACKCAGTPHFTYASTSSVYGANTELPFSEHHSVNHPLQFYAATKRANELIAHAYSHLFQLPTTGLRFFTVYGPWGRPDMALFKFTRAILSREPIKVYNNGNHTRDFTYIDDIVSGLIGASDKIAEPDMHWESNTPDPARSNSPFRIFNIGNSKPIKLINYIRAIENALGLTARLELLPLQPGDVPDTSADISEISQAIGYRPRVTVEEGVRRFVHWYKTHYHAEPNS